jgi:hypothetical protein
MIPFLTLSCHIFASSRQARVLFSCLFLARAVVAAILRGRYASPAAVCNEGEQVDAAQCIRALDRRTFVDWTFACATSSSTPPVVPAQSPQDRQGKGVSPGVQKPTKGNSYAER